MLHRRGLLRPPEPASLVQMVKLVREPNNPYDKWAVRVDNVVGEKVGHLSRQVALVVRSFTLHGNLVAQTHLNTMRTD